jgi:hypothetical protein
MKIADLLRGLADKLDGIETGGSEPNPNQTRLDPVGEVPGGDTDTTKMVPPLQAKLEILKKSEGLPSVYDNECQESQPDELAMIKKNAGLTAVQHEASEDNDITG